jgi:hypothetical protein
MPPCPPVFQPEAVSGFPSLSAPILGINVLADSHDLNVACFSSSARLL